MAYAKTAVHTRSPATRTRGRYGAQAAGTDIMGREEQVTGPNRSLAIVGSTSLEGNLTALLLVEMAVYFWKPDLIISGGAPGVDAMARDTAQLRRIPYQIWQPINQRWEPDGYKARNIKIAESCGSLICIRAKDAKTYGSGWTADYTESLGKMVYRYYV